MVKSIQELVQEQVQAKVASGEALEAAVRDVEDAATQLREAESVASKARRSALKSGWSESELRSLGLAGKGRARRQSSTDSADDVSRADGVAETSPAYASE